MSAKPHSPKSSSIISAADYDRIAGEIQFPLKIHGFESSGASYATLRLMTYLLKKGYKFAFFSARFEAKKSLMKMLKEEEMALVLDLSRLSSNLDKKVILVEGFDSKIIEDALEWVEPERILVVKNIEELDLDTKSKLPARKQIILSGNWTRLNLPDFQPHCELQFSAYPEQPDLHLGDYQVLLTLWK